MSQYLLINRIKVQGANAIAGFTWGFPAITHFLGFSHNLSRKLSKHKKLFDIHLSGCAVIAHWHQVHTYGFNQFTQSRNPSFQYKEQAKNKVGSPPIIEEGKMDMEVSLLISCEGNIGNRKEELIQWLENICQLQRLAGGTILSIQEIDLYLVDDEQNRKNLRMMIRKLLPGFVLLDRSVYLENHFQELQKNNPDAELFDAWMDFITLKQKARPQNTLIQDHFEKQESNPRNETAQDLLNVWQMHLELPYEQQSIPDELSSYFSNFEETKNNNNLLAQWRSYCNPDTKTDAVWEYVEKPDQGFLVPIMTGYKAISQIYENHEVANTRDNETDVCFVEALHSVGEWQGVHRIKDESDLQRKIWYYHYEPNWYLCKQKLENSSLESTDDDFS